MLNINIEEQENYQILQVVGEIDASTSITLDNALKTSSEATKNVLLDLSQLEYISSAGLGVFISYLDDFKSKSIKLVLFGLHEKVLEVFQILGLQHLMQIVPDQSSAVELINA